MAGLTANDPVIVSSWAEFVTALTAKTKYIKWADGDNKYIDEVDISSQITCDCKQVDFNGWTIDRLFIYDLDEYCVFHKTGYEASRGIEYIFNLTINHLNVLKTAKAGIFLFGGIVNCYFYDIYYQSHDSAYSDEEHGYVEFDFQTGACANICDFAYNSILSMRSEDYAPRIPTQGAKNCEIGINYKWTKDGLNNWSNTLWGKQHYNASPYEVAAYYQCYIHGKIDITEGEDTWHWSSQGYTYNGYIHTESSIINIEVLMGNETGDSTFDKIYVNCDGEADGLFVTNNGNSMSFLQNNIKSVGAVDEMTFKGSLTLEGDLKNKDWLNDIEFNFIDDDLHREPQYINPAEFSPYTDWTWRKSNYVNHSVPFLPFWKYPVVEPPVYRGDVYEAEYICIYDLTTQQNEFTGHGLAILRPTSCRIVEELNGAYSLTLTHPKDDEGRWAYILEMNIIKCMGQLFVIQRVDETLTGGSYQVTAYAEHISYTLNDRWIFPPVTIAGYHGSTLMASILEQSTDMGGDWQTQYTFTVESDIDAPEEFRDWYEMPDGVTPYEMLVGSSGFIAKLGGELYRDNFTMKINKRMYGAEDKAFELAIGYNLTGIKRTVDLTTFCTYFRAYDTSNDDYETWWAVSYDPSTLPRAYPRNVVRSANFSYDHEEYKEGQLERDGFAFWNQNCAPLITYELSVKDLRRNPDYMYFANNYRFRVGDKGRVWDERLQAWVEVEITRTEKDGVTGETTKVVIGSQRSFTRPNSYNPIVPVTINADKTLEGFTPLTFNGDGTPLKHCIIYGADGGVGDDLEVFTPSASTTHYDTTTGYADSVTGYYSAGYINVNPEWTYTVTAQFETTGGQLVYEVLYYTNTGAFISSETASAADDSFTFTTPSTAKLMRVQAASEDVIEKYGMTTFGISITIESYASQTIIKPLTAPLLDGDSVDYTDIPTYNGETVLTVNNTVSPKVKIQYREPIDHDINKTIEDVPPLTFRSNGDNLTNWLIYGNAGGVGSVSPNLFNGELENAKYSAGVKVGTDTGYISTVDTIPCEASTEYSFSAYTTLQFGAYSCYLDRIEYNSNGEYIKTTTASLTVRNNQTNNGKSTFTTSANTAYVRFSLDVTGASSLTLSTVPDIMFYLGSTKKPYEPYGGGLTVNISNGTISQNIIIPITALLEKGETISLQTSGVDIPTYNGVNTLTVTSDVQPEKVKIQYKEPLT